MLHKQTSQFKGNLLKIYAFFIFTIGSQGSVLGSSPCGSRWYFTDRRIFTPAPPQLASCDEGDVQIFDDQAFELRRKLPEIKKRRCFFSQAPMALEQIFGLFVGSLHVLCSILLNGKNHIRNPSITSQSLRQSLSVDSVVHVPMSLLWRGGFGGVCRFDIEASEVHLRTPTVGTGNDKLKRYMAAEPKIGGFWPAKMDGENNGKHY